MKFFIVAIFLLSSFCLLRADAKFSELDSTLRESARLRTVAVKEYEAWRVESERVKALIISARDRAKAIEGEAHALSSQVDARLSRDKIIAQKIARDESALESIDLELIKAYSNLLSKASMFECVKTAPTLEQFKEKKSSEKLRCVSSLLQEIFEEDCILRDGKNEVSTGVIVKAQGARGNAEVSELKVKEGAK